jgi:hypothetical protein
MKECDNSKIHISSNFLLSVFLLLFLDTFIARIITTLQHFATLHHTSPNYTSLHLSTLHFLSTLHLSSQMSGEGFRDKSSNQCIKYLEF